MDGLEGGLLGLLIFLPFYWLGGMGAADLKLLGLVGVYLGPQGVLYSALYTALAGGVLALLALVFHASRRLPYAVAIAVGVGVYEFRSFMSP
jgi:Type IV leader peptidase family.